MGFIVFRGDRVFTPVRFRRHLVFRVIFELPPYFGFAGLGYARQVPRFIGIFDSVTHRVGGTFHLFFRVVFESEFAAGAVCCRFELFFGVIRERDRVTVLISFLRQSSFASRPSVLNSSLV